MRIPVLLCLPLVALLTLGCLAPSNYQQIPPPTATAPDRTDCGQILGTAFRSEAEEAWFATNCSSWAPATLGRVDEASGAGGPPPAQPGLNVPPSPTVAVPAGSVSQSGVDANAQRCVQLKDKAYTSADERVWFLANCLATPTAGTQPADGPGPEACDQLGGTSGLSPAELAWFLANCR